MSGEPAETVSDLVEKARSGDELAASRLMPIVYDELRRIAGAYMAHERPGQTIQPTALVHEAYLRLLKDKRRDWTGRTHFLAIAATSMRQILIERARARQTAKRGGARQRITLDESVLAGDAPEGGEGEPSPGAAALDLLAVDDALRRLAAIDARQARIVELRFFGGLTIEETAAATGTSPATVKRDWTLARAWLRREVAPQARTSGPAGDAGHGCGGAAG